MRLPFSPLSSIILINTLSSIPLASAATRHVPADHPTIQSCIDAATNGDECVVAPGTYNELINFLGKAITLRSSHGAAVTTIDGTDLNGSVVTFLNYEGPNSVLDGLTITGGQGHYGFGGQRLGGGIRGEQASPTIRNNIIRNNTATSGITYPSIGGGLFLDYTSATVSNNVILENVANVGGGLFIRGPASTVENNVLSKNRAFERGGGLYVVGAATISGNVISDNSSTDGAGIYLFGSPSSVLRNYIHGNRTDYDGTGGAIYVNDSDCVIVANDIIGNSANSVSAIYLTSSDATIANNKIAGNGASDATVVMRSSLSHVVNNTIIGNYGNGLTVYGTSQPTISNCIIAFNSAGVDIPSTLTTFRNNCVHGNDRYDYSSGSRTGLNGNISTNPLMADHRFGNIRLQPLSLCRNAGINADVFGGSDYEGQLRIQDNLVDIGADECDDIESSPGPYTIVHVRSEGDDNNDGSTWQHAKKTVQAGIDAAALVGGEVRVNVGVYTGTGILLKPFVYVRGGFRETTSGAVKNGQTVFDGLYAGTILLVNAGHKVSSVEELSMVRGRNFGNSGGAIRLINSSPTIRNCAISGNHGYSGGGIYISGGAPLLSGITVAGNSSANNGYTGAISVILASPTIINSIIAFNLSGIKVTDSAQNQFNPVLRNNIIYGNTVFDFTGFSNSSGSNLIVDPMFIRIPSHGGDGWGDNNSTPDVDESSNDDVGNLRLRQGSPGINTGDPSYIPPSGEADLDGHARVLCGRVDMGAYESGIGDYDCDQGVNLADVAAMQTCFTGDSGEPYNQGCESLDFEFDGDVDAVDLTEFTETLADP